MKLKLLEIFRSDKHGCARSDLGPFIPEDQSRDDDGSRVCELPQYYCQAKLKLKLQPQLMEVELRNIFVLVHPSSTGLVVRSFNLN